MGRTITIDEAIDEVRANAPLMPVQTVTLHKAADRALAAAVVASRDQPPFAASAMDGYAVVSESLTPEIPLLRMIGESQAGKRFSGHVGIGEAVRIFTGAPIPEGADTIVIQENTERAGEWLTILPDGRNLTPRHIRPAGQDFRKGTTLLDAGLRLDGWRLALAAAAGQSEVAVRRRPEVVVLCTGNELVQVGETPLPDQIYESGSHAIMALIAVWGGKARFVGVAGDHLKTLHKALKKIVRHHAPDLIVTIGGASVGDFDLVRPALDKLGMERAFDSVKARPGKPTSFGKLADGTAVLSLPGNPASGLVMAQLLLKTWLEAALGLKAGPQFLPAVLQNPLPAAGPRETFLRGQLSASQQGQFQVSVLADQDSSLVSVFSRADALVRLPAHAPPMSAGARVEVLPLERL